MRLGWIGSVIAHVVMLAATFLAWPHDAPDLPPPSAVVPVDIIDKITDVTNVTAMAPPEPETPEEAPLAPEGAPQDMTPPTPDAPEVIADPRQKQKLKQEPRRPTTSLTDLADLIDRSKKEKGRTNAGASAAERGDNPRDAIGAGTDMTASESDAIKSAIERNRQRFIDLPNYERLRVTIEVRINADGSLAGAPRVVRTSLPQSDPYMRTAVERSIRAILVSEPLPISPTRTQRATFTMNFYDRDVD